MRPSLLVASSLSWLLPLVRCNYPLPQPEDKPLDCAVRAAAHAYAVALHGNRSAMPNLDDFKIKPVTDLAGLTQMRAVVRQIRLSDELVDYVVDLIRATRSHSSVSTGASPRAANMLATASRAQAVLNGREFVIPDDIKRLVPAVLRHRIVLSPGAEVEGVTANQVLSSILQSVPAPR